MQALRSKDAHTTAAALYSIFCIVGFPEIVQSDNGPEFVNAVIGALVDLLNADHRLITAYHARGNGAAERNVGLTIKTIRKLLDGAIIDWDLKVPGVQFALNTRVCENHGSAPFSLFFARAFPGFRRAVLPQPEGSVPLAVTEEVTPYTTIHEWEHIIKQMEEIVYPALREYRDKIIDKRAKRFNKMHKIVDYPVSSHVMAYDQTRTSKLDPIYEGPYKIVRRKGGAYTLQDHDGILLKQNYAPSQLIPVPEPAIPTKQDEIFTIERVLDHRDDGKGSYIYLIKWKGFNDTYNSWEPTKSFFDTQSIAIYWHSQSGNSKLQPALCALVLGDAAKLRRTNIHPLKILEEGDVLFEFLCFCVCVFVFALNYFQSNYLLTHNLSGKMEEFKA